MKRDSTKNVNSSAVDENSYVKDDVVHVNARRTTWKWGLCNEDEWESDRRDVEMSWSGNQEAFDRDTFGDRVSEEAVAVVIRYDGQDVAIFHRVVDHFRFSRIMEERWL